MLPMIACSEPSLQQQIDAAVAKGEQRFVLPAGEHRLDHALELTGLTDFTLEGDDAVLIFTDWHDGGMMIRECEGLDLKGFTIDFDPLPFTQVTIDRKDSDTREVYFSVQEGYPDLAPELLTGRAHIFSPETYEWKLDAPDIYAKEAKAINSREGFLRFSAAQQSVFDAIELGDFVVLDFRHSRGIRMENCSDVRIDDVTIWSVPSIGVICRFMDGTNVFSYRIEPGPTPPGASVPRLFSTCADGFNYAYARTGPVLEDCDFSGMGDDAVNLHGIAFYVARVEGKTVYLLRPYNEEAFASVIRPGDEVRSMRPDTFGIKGTATSTSFAVEQNPPDDFAAIAEEVWQSKAVKSGRLTVYRLELEDELNVQAGDFLEVPAISAPGYIIRNNTFYNHRGCGLRLMSSRGIIQDNVIENVKQGAIKLGAELTFFREAGWVQDIIVSGNTIRNAAFDMKTVAHNSYAPGAIAVFHRGASPETPLPDTWNRNIIITDNLIKNTGAAGIFLNQSHNVFISRNTLIDTNQTSTPETGSGYGVQAMDPISINNSTDIVIEE